MLSFIYNVMKSITQQKSIIENDADEINNAIARIENASKKEIQTNEYFDKNTSFNTGNITFIATDYVLVDNIFFCDKAQIAINDFEVGDRVLYSASVDNDKQKHKIKIISKIDGSCDNGVLNSQTNIAESQSLTKCIIGYVTERDNRLLTIQPNDIVVNLDKVQIEFIPVIGDWLTLESQVEINESSYDLNEEILEIQRVQPLRSMLNVGTISSFDPIKAFGVIDKVIVFNKTICDPGYIPCVGDQVVSDSIESDQGMYKWRSLTVAPLFKVSKISPLSDVFSTYNEKDLSDLLENKNSIIITKNLNIDLEIEEEKNVRVTIQNVGDTTHVLLKGCFTTKAAQSQLTLVQPSTVNAVSLDLNPSDTLIYIFKCTAKFVGISEELFIFKFKEFEIGRIFNITVKPKTTKNKSNSTIDDIKVTKFRVPDLDESSQDTYIPGVRLRKPPSFIKVPNGHFKIPEHYWKLILQCIDEQKSQTDCEYEIGNAIPSLSNRLCLETYKDRFHTLLYLEEIAEILNMQQYNIDSAVMRRCGEYLVMEVPGLAEKRPSLIIGDRAVVSFIWDSSQGKLKYEGYIHKVANKEIFLKFHYKFHDTYNYEACQVTFKCSRTSIQRCHNAINMAVHRLGQNFLFPTSITEKESQIDIEKLETKNKPIVKPLTHQRTDSVSSESSSSTSKSMPKLTVVERLFNVKPTEQDTEVSVKTVAVTKDVPYDESRNETDINKNVAHELRQDTKETPTSTCDTNLLSYISQVKKRKLYWFNENLNYYQKEAVRNVLKGRARPLPYVVFGPPGTGKTSTLCEIILQILTLIPESRLLVATPSNSSANLISERLLDSGVLRPGDMVRLVAHHCLNDDSIPSKLLPYCATAELADENSIQKAKYNGVGPRINCPMSVLGRHRITVGTCIALGILNNMGFPHGHFSHILVDEAGQATEPEIMIPLNFTHSDYGQVILAGDPLQLGPVVQSKLANYFGLGESFLSRLLRHFHYQRDSNSFETQYNPKLVTRLIFNYRSLPEILELSSSLFYDSELKAQVSPKESKEAKLLETLAAELPERKGSPPAIVFHGVIGENCKDNDSPSWYNPVEATQVYLYLLKLYKCGLSPDDVGIITPYQKQVLQIRELLMELNVELPKISSVEGFQGQERNVIIISVVRSSAGLVNEDIKHSLGFVACPRRLNVAITRARALVIILGNPKLLAQDPYWRSVLIYCINRDSYTGCSFGYSDLDDLGTRTNNFLTNEEINNS
ncbi:probable RNA helicase armi [Ceratina calcarata]|uniref:RNA helicase n=1 Tax=Ceratina calcarata TaxID=156304 RepID=A0AAJ7WEW1_9HYME|nr:probable RNA helicase armi [Ceratina calcarata]